MLSSVPTTASASVVDSASILLFSLLVAAFLSAYRTSRIGLGKVLRSEQGTLQPPFGYQR
jgi:hypothetical protein